MSSLFYFYLFSDNCAIELDVVWTDWRNTQLCPTSTRGRLVRYLAYFLGWLYARSWGSVGNTKLTEIREMDMKFTWTLVLVCIIIDFVDPSEFEVKSVCNIGKVTTSVSWYFIRLFIVILRINCDWREGTNRLIFNV